MASKKTILVHFFLRVLKKKTYLMADSAAEPGEQPLWDTPEAMFEVDPETDRVEWIERAVNCVTSRAPGLELIKVFKPRKRKGSLQVFDMTFKQGGPEKKGVLEKLGLKK